MNQNNSQNQFRDQNNGIQYNKQGYVPVGSFQQSQSYQQSPQMPNPLNQYSREMQSVQSYSAKPRAVSAEEVMQQQHVMTQQELQETQVLNLKDVQEIARIERLTSKKPAIVVAIIGILFLMIGTSFHAFESLKNKESRVEKRTIQEPRKENTLLKKELNCSKTAFNNPDATDTVYNISYEFEDNKLIGFTKVFSINAISGNPLASQTMQNYMFGYQSFLNQLDGYSITVVPNQDITQIIATVKVDLKKLDLAQLPEVQQNHFSTKVDYIVGTDRNIIEKEMLEQSFSCQ